MGLYGSPELHPTAATGPADAGLRFCPDCGAERLNASRFCANCGYRFAAPAPLRPPARVATASARPAFFRGLIVAFIGFVTWLLASVVEGISEGTGGEPSTVMWTIISIGFFVMVGGPLYYWLARPLWRLLRRPRQSKADCRMS